LRPFVLVRAAGTRQDEYRNIGRMILTEEPPLTRRLGELPSAGLYFQENTKISVQMLFNQYCC